jgi:hypothetical protein
VLFGQPVDDFALGFVTPLQTDYASSRHRRDLMAGREGKPRRGKRFRRQTLDARF